MDRLKISVVMPTFNEEKAIPGVVADIRKYTADHDTEVLIVDSSKDNTPAVATSLGVKVISQPPQGHGIALRTAMLAASGDYIITADCDNTYPMDRIGDFLDLLGRQPPGKPPPRLPRGRALWHPHPRCYRRHVRLPPPGGPCRRMGHQLFVPV